MTAKSYDLTFEGYWREPNVGGLPRASGIYGAYAATYNAGDGTVSLNRLIYVGEAQNVRDRVHTHEKWATWRRQLRHGEILCFNAALISPASDRARAEAAMIFEHKPVCNDDYMHSFPFEQTTITTRGRNALMKASFTVYPTQAQGGLGLAGLGLRRR